MPFVPWHQPFWNEAGVYTVRVTLPRDQLLVTPAKVASETAVREGWKQIQFEPFTGRDFAILASEHYRTSTTTATLGDGREVAIRCHSVRAHAHTADEMVKIAKTAIETYSKWFGPYPYDQFTVVESYFGWNGNECAGLVMIDERVFDMPQVGRGYIEYLLSHETCHQWWYNLIGTNGFSETFMDEGPATYFTHRLLDKLRGKNNELLEWPASIRFAPNIRRENYRHGPLTSAIRRHEVPPAAGQLDDFGNLFALFSGAYDRGSKVFGLIENRMGEEAFFDFLRGIAKKYSFRVLSAANLKRELEEYTGKDWDALFDRWVYGSGLTDWGIESVRVDGQRPRGLLGVRERWLFRPRATPHRVEVIVRQSGEYDEPTVLGVKFESGDRFPIRIPIGPTTQSGDFPEFSARVIPLGNRTLRVTMLLDRMPTNIVVDPDGVLLDGDRANNSWDRTPRVNLSPFYNSTSETDLTTDYDRWNFNLGAWVWGPSFPDPWYTRSSMLGLRAGAFRTQTYQGGVYSAFRTDTRDVAIGVDGVFDHWPLPKTQVGYNYERRIAGPFFGQTGIDGANRASLFGRYVFRPSSSFYLQPLHYLDAFTTYQDNFLPIAREGVPGSQRPAWTWLSGVHHRLNLYTPYWDPARGFWLDLVYSGGLAKLDQTVAAHQLRGEFAAARKLPDGLGWASNIKLTARAVVGGSFPTRGQFFALGGGTLFRGFDLAERQGNWFWSVNAETRLPILADARWNFFDNLAGLRTLSVVPFYDVGAIYASQQRVGNVAHAVGVGFRADLAIFSFIERATFRFDVAKTVNAASPFQFWFGLQHPF
jgi:hypothetical protein